MSIYIYRNNQQSGPFEEAAILTWLKNGQLSPEDLACRIGASEWQRLKVMFASPAQMTKNFVALPASGNNGQAFYNQPVVNWARQALLNRAEVKLKYNSLFAKIIIYSLLFSAPAMFMLFGVYQIITAGSVSQSLPIFVLVAIMALPLALLVLLTQFKRNSFIKYLDADGAENLCGKKYHWKHLRFINYKKAKPTQKQFGLIANPLIALAFSGSDKITVELVFETGKAVIPPLIYSQAEILNLIRTIPVQCLDAATIRQQKEKK